MHNLTGFLQNKIITTGIREAFFKNQTAIGLKFHDAFHPIPLVTLALLICAVSYGSFIITSHLVADTCIQVDFCIHEWSTGSFEQAKFRETDIKTRYNAYLAKLHEWSEVDPGVTRNMRKKLSTRARYISRFEAVCVCANSGLY